MIAIVTKGQDRRQIVRFVCEQCGCVYDATEDECSQIFNRVYGIGFELKCPMPFCDCINRSFEPINKED